MSIESKLFARLQGETITQYTLKNSHHLALRLITFGARVQQLRLPDQTGADPNLIAGFVTLQDYLQQPEPFGALMGPDCLHPTRTDWQNWNWEAQIIENTVVMQLHLTDGLNDLPGTQTITVTHQLDDDNVWTIHLQVQSDTPIELRPNYNLAFMLTGDPARTIDHQQMTLGDMTKPVAATQTTQTHVQLSDDRWTLRYQANGGGLAISTYDHIDESTNFNGILGHPKATVGIRALATDDDQPILVNAAHAFEQTTRIKLQAN
ncbi:aldose epimerase [Lacticaseibacillus porcinae]|uniref:aldose epimerase n=1 Tax=Lacticaseibacillus porcinae TaxID=1123687 RepID=UPI0013DDD074|nr:aldose epimerase [Lacticaseibacillus porcinae]